MIDHVWSVVCSRAVIDSDSNNVSLQNVLEQISVAEDLDPDQTNTIPTRFEVVTLWARSEFDESAQGLQKVTLLSPAGEALVAAEAQINLAEARRYRYRAKFSALPLRGEGRYVFRIEYRTGQEEAWTKVADIPLEVVVNPELRKELAGEELPV